MIGSPFRPFISLISGVRRLQEFRSAVRSELQYVLVASGEVIRPRAARSEGFWCKALKGSNGNKPSEKLTVSESVERLVADKISPLVLVRAQLSPRLFACDAYDACAKTHFED